MCAPTRGHLAGERSKIVACGTLLAIGAGARPSEACLVLGPCLAWAVVARPSRQCLGPGLTTCFAPCGSSPHMTVCEKKVTEKD